jgi:hypothetical protein
MPTKSERTPVHRPVTGQAASPLLYINSVNVIGGPEEIILHMGVRNPDNPNDMTPVVSVATSLSHAKRLVEALNSQLALLEEAFGPIPLTPEPIIDPERLRKLGVDE